jgi:hypothetical protein
VNAIVGLVVVVIAAAVIGMGFAALLLLGMWAGRLTAHCMAMPLRSDSQRFTS